MLYFFLLKTGKFKYQPKYTKSQMKDSCSDRKPKSISILDILKKMRIWYLNYIINDTHCSKYNLPPVSWSSSLSWRCFSRLFSFAKQGIICIIHVYTTCSFSFFSNTDRGSGPQLVSPTLSYEAIEFMGSLHGYTWAGVSDWWTVSILLFL